MILNEDILKKTESEINKISITKTDWWYTIINQIERGTLENYVIEGFLEDFDSLLIDEQEVKHYDKRKNL